MDSDYVWALLGLFCLIVMFAMMAAGIRNVRDEPDLAVDNRSPKDLTDE